MIMIEKMLEYFFPYYTGLVIFLGLLVGFAWFLYLSHPNTFKEHSTKNSFKAMSVTNK